jgi:adenylate cyclase
MQYLNAAFEICLPSFIIFYVAIQFPSYNVLQSPAVFIYFIFIILSTLRLNVAISIFCGTLASFSYACFSFFIYGHFDSNDAARTLILLFSGIAAGLVANQVRSGINHSLVEAEKRRKVESLFGQQLSLEVAEKMLENDGKIESKKMNTQSCLSISATFLFTLLRKILKRLYNIRMHFSALFSIQYQNIMASYINSWAMDV